MDGMLVLTGGLVIGMAALLIVADMITADFRSHRAERRAAADKGR